MSLGEERQYSTVMDLPRIRDAAKRLCDWLEERIPVASPRRYEAKEPGRGYRRSVEGIVNENTSRSCWDEEWFGEGIMAFTLIALESEGALVLHAAEHGVVRIHFRCGPQLTLEEFKSGELSLEYKCDSSFSGMNLNCVKLMYLALERCSDS